MTIRRVFLAFLITVCLLALIGLAPVPSRAQYSYQDKVLSIDSGNLLGYWPFDEITGTVADDLANGAGNGTYNGPTLASVAAVVGSWANAPSFDGINDYVDLPSLSLGNSSFTVSAWVKIPAFSAHYSVFSLFTDASQHFNFAVLNSTGQLNAGIVGASSTTTGSITANIWQHVAVTYDYGTDTQRLYINGVLDATSNAGPFAGAAPTTRVSNNNGNQFVNGAIDEVAIWSVALADEDIELLADTDGLPTPTPTNTGTMTPTATATLQFGSHIVLSSGQVGAFYYTLDTGAVMLGLLLLLQIGLLLALLALRMWRRA